MNIYWTLRQIPELRDLPKDQRSRVWRHFYFRDYKVKMIDLLGSVAVAAPGMWLLTQVDHPTSSATLFCALSMGLILVIVGQVRLRLLRPSIREYLKAHEHI
jgi:hypothetical protein